MFELEMGDDHNLIQIPGERRSRAASPIYVPPTVTVQPTRGGSDFYWKQIMRILRKHWRFSLLFGLTFLTAITTATLLMKDTYEASARVEIEPPAGPETVTLRDVPGPTPDAQDYLQTQIEVLKSNQLAIDVIRTLHLDQNIAPGKSRQDSWKSAAMRTLHLDQIFKTPARSPLDIALNDFRNRLSVDQVRNSRVVEVGFSSDDPRLAALVANTLVKLYVERSHRSRYEDTMQAAGWLSGELNDLRQGVEKANQALVNFQNANDIVEFSDSQDTGNSKQNPVTQKVADLNRQLTQAQSERIQQEAFLKMIEAGSADSLPQMRDNPVLQDSTKRYVEARAQLAQAQAIYGKNNSNLEKLQNQADELEAQLTAERQRIVRQVKTGYEAARARELLLTQALNDMKGSVDRMNQKMIQYSLLKREAQAASDLYNTLSLRLREAAISAGLKSTNIRVVDEARIPDKPAKPHRLQIIALGMVFSVLAGLALAFLRESFDDTVRTADDIKAWTGLHSLAMFPLVASANTDGRHLLARPIKLLGNGAKKERDASGVKFFLERPRSAEAEAVRSLQTSIRLLSRTGGNALRVILLASASPNEGKTTVALNLAMALAQRGKTCLVDADLRNPVMARTFGLSFQQGLEDVLKGSAALEDTLLEVPDVANLTILPAGASAPNPGELVNSEAMREVLRGLRERFDHVVIDSPPVIPFADARWLSSLSDGVVLVARYGSTTRQAMIWSTETLAEVDAPVLGVVLNGVDLKSEYYWYEPYKYTYA